MCPGLGENRRTNTIPLETQDFAETLNFCTHGVGYALNPPFNRHRGDAVIGQIVRALDVFLGSAKAQAYPFNRIHFLRAAPPTGSRVTVSSRRRK